MIVHLVHGGVGPRGLEVHGGVGGGWLGGGRGRLQEGLGDARPRDGAELVLGVVVVAVEAAGHPVRVVAVVVVLRRRPRPGLGPGSAAASLGSRPREEDVENGPGFLKMNLIMTTVWLIIGRPGPGPGCRWRDKYQ